MEKQLLKTALKTLTVGDTLTVNFRKEKSQYSGLLTVASVRTGRGKGGSLLLELKTEDGTMVSTGTPDSDNILNLTTPNGEFFGYESENEVPLTFIADAAQSTNLKAVFAALIAGQSVSVESTHSEFGGDFTVVGVSKCRGRGGQLQASLQAADGSTVDIMSNRHSGVITSFVVHNLPQNNEEVLSEATEVSSDADDYIASVLAGIDEDTETTETDSLDVDTDLAE